MSNIKERIKELRKEKNLTQEELAKKLGLNAKSNIANYESGANAPSDEIKLKMCELFNCSMDYLMGKSNYKNEDDYLNKNIDNIADTLDNIEKFCIKALENNLEVIDFDAIVSQLTTKNIPLNSLKKHISKYIPATYPKEYANEATSIIYDLYMYNKMQSKESSDKIELTNKYYMCPVYGQISAGQPNWAEECIEGRLPLDPDLMGIVNPEEHFFLRVNGESMNKVVRNGAFALIHKQDIVEDGEIAAVLVNGYDATLKKFTRQGDMIILEPQSDDDSFKTQVYDKTTPIKILGKYVGKMEINK